MRWRWLGTFKYRQLNLRFRNGENLAVFASRFFSPQRAAACIPPHHLGRSGQRLRTRPVSTGRQRCFVALLQIHREINLVTRQHGFTNCWSVTRFEFTRHAQVTHRPALAAIQPFKTAPRARHQGDRQCQAVRRTGLSSCEARLQNDPAQSFKIDTECVRGLRHQRLAGHARRGLASAGKCRRFYRA